MSCRSSLLCTLFKINLFIFTIYAFVYSEDGQTVSEGDLCGDDKTGICTFATECPPAVESIMKTGSHDFERCGFRDKTEIVCCPEGEVTRPRFPDVSDEGERKCVKACTNYSSQAPPFIHFNIINGDAATIGEFPHMVALGYRKPNEDEIQWNCAGTLISDRYVLTAAHCIVTVDTIAPSVARLGIVNITGPNEGNASPQDYGIENITVHSEYKGARKINDIALIKLNKKVTMSDYIQPACLYTENDDPIGLVVTGWGVIENGDEKMSDSLQKANIFPVPLDECNATLVKRTRKPLQTSQICAYHNKSDTCQGDSGGPLQVSKNGSSIYNIVGVTSYGISCGGPYPGVYTRVSSYINWIEKIVWP